MELEKGGGREDSVCPLYFYDACRHPNELLQQP